MGGVFSICFLSLLSRHRGHCALIWLLSSTKRGKKKSGRSEDEEIEMKIFVKTLKGSNFEIDVSPDDKVVHLSLDPFFNFFSQFLFLALIRVCCFFWNSRRS